MSDLKSYTVWDAGTRWCHWINALCVIGLAAVGLAILNDGNLGVTNPGKVALKTVHVWIGYVFALNLLWRIVWGFMGNRYARWGHILPWGKGYWRALQGYVAASRPGRRLLYLGHNPLGRLSVGLLFLLLMIQAITGLALAGTDLFYPPFGRWIAQWVAASHTAPDALVPYAPELYDASAYERMRVFRKPVVSLHLYSFYALMAAIVVHVAAVVIAELKEGGCLISAMFTGKKIMSAPPVDDDGA
jgi:Ni/Fe-hydrogenase 1 B-type cytochrome subunit